MGAVDFFEIANTHLYALDTWYALLNCGYRIPPAAGTDLPNYPFRDAWQPFLGSMRMYVRVGSGRDFASWKKALLRGEVFVSSGPTVEFTVDGEGPGATIRLPEDGGEVALEAELATPIGLRTMEVVKNGEVVRADIVKSEKDRVHRWKVRQRLLIRSSCWLAVRGEGVPIESLKELARDKRPWTKMDVVAHSGPVWVEVGTRPVRSTKDAVALLLILRRQREYYRDKGAYEQGKHRLHVQDLFDRAIAELQTR